MNWFQATVKDTLDSVGSSLRGLSEHEAQKRLNSQGRNELKTQGRKSAWWILFAQFKEVMILILLAAAVISFFVGDAKDAIIIMVIVLLNAVVGFVQEFNAEKAMYELKKLAATMAKVIREGEIKKISADELVTGDIVMLEAGDSVPADLRLIEIHSLKIDEASLTGESYPVEKNLEPIANDQAQVGDRINMAFKSTLVSYGRAVGVVVATGMNTEIGKIASLLQQPETDTPLQKRMTDFSKKLSVIIVLICAVIYGVGLLRGEDQLQMLMTAVSVAVAAIPEALPAVITVALALGARRMVRNNALIRKLPAVETLGSVNFICTDKTGTLTQNKMLVRETWTAADLIIGIPAQEVLLLAMSLNQDTHSKGEQRVGDSTEVAAVLYAQKQDPKLIHATTYYPRINEIPFESDRRMMTTIHQFNDGYLVITKGAVESVLQRCKQSNLQAIISKADAIAENGMRTLAYACKIIELNPVNQHYLQEAENDLQFIGVIGMIDPPRPEVKDAVKECKAAGITPVMITGDHPKTAMAIARELGIMDGEDQMLTGIDLAGMSFEKLIEKAEHVRVYARVSAEQKLNIVKALQAEGHYVAMTGDGVNDSPSLKMANIGVAMGITGTDVSKEAAHMVLLDDNFTTIVKAVREGRRIFDNIRKFIRYIMTGNAGEIWTIFLAPVIGLPIPLLPIHILWINLVTDGLPSLALAKEPAEANIMKRPPRSSGNNVFADGVGMHILWVGLLIGALCLGIQAGTMRLGIEHWQTMVFTTLSLCQLAHVIAIRSSDTFIYRHGFFRNKILLITVLATVALQLAIVYVPFLQRIFNTAALSFNELVICIGAATIVFHLVELEKWIRNLRRR
jgi:P-type Ca2+ transporter type 2C